MHPYKMRLKCLKLAQGMTYDPEGALRLQLNIEFKSGIEVLPNSWPDPFSIAPLSAAQREQLDQALAEILLDDMTPRLH